MNLIVHVLPPMVVVVVAHIPPPMFVVVVLHIPPPMVDVVVVEELVVCEPPIGIPMPPIGGGPIIPGWPIIGGAIPPPIGCIIYGCWGAGIAFYGSSA